MLGNLKKQVQVVFFVLLAILAGHVSAFAGTVNVILMICDGQGIGNIMAADFYCSEKAVYESFPNKFLVTTYAANGSYKPDQAWKSFEDQMNDPTDSAAAATAMATGVKTKTGIIGKSEDLKDLANIVELASLSGKSTGIVTTVSFSDATPSAFSVHNASRKNKSEIARSMIYESGLDVIIGAGHPFYDDDCARKSIMSDFSMIGGEDVFGDLTDSDGARAMDGKKWKYIESVTDFEKISSGTERPEKLFGLARAGVTINQARSGDPQKVDLLGKNMNVPSLPVMAEAALNSLSTDPDGFFLLIEGGAVDLANHVNQKGRAIEEQVSFNSAAEKVVSWIEKNGGWEKNLLIVTADHETGYLWGDKDTKYTLVRNMGKGVMPEMYYHSKRHSNLPVPLYAKGRGSELFKGLVDGKDAFYSSLISSFDPGFSGDFVDNTDIFRVIDSALKK